MEYPSEASRASATNGRMLCGSCVVAGMPTRAIAGSHCSSSGRSAEHPEMSRSLSVLSPTKNRSAPSSSVNACRGPPPPPAGRAAEAGDGDGQRPFPPAYTNPPPLARADAVSTSNATSAAARAASAAAVLAVAAGAAVAAKPLSASRSSEASSRGSFGSFGGSREGSSGVPGTGSPSGPSPAGLGGSFASSPGTFPATAVVASDRPSVDFGLASTETTASASSFDSRYAKSLVAGAALAARAAA